MFAQNSVKRFRCVLTNPGDKIKNICWIKCSNPLFKNVKESTSFCYRSLATTHNKPSAAIFGEAAYKRRRDVVNIDGNDNAYASNPVSIETVLAHSGIPGNFVGELGNISSKSEQPQNYPLSPSIELASTYERPANGDYGPDGRIYSRTCNPTRKLLEDTMIQLELGNFRFSATHKSSNAKNHIVLHSSNPKEDSKIVKPVSAAFSSGMAAVAAIFLANPKCRVLIPDDCYHGTTSQLMNVLNHHHGIDYQKIDTTDESVIKKEILMHISDESTSARPLVIWLESPSNPLTKVTDIKKVCDLVHMLRRRNDKHDISITTVVDSTWAPPCITRPLQLGADAVLHSATKYLGGHSDILLGVITTSPNTPGGIKLGSVLPTVQSSIGAVASPFDAWLCLRGLRTLGIRVERQCRNALKIAEFLHNHPSVAKVHYPGLKSHPQHEIAKRQMALFGGMLSFEMETEDMAMALAGGVTLIKRGTSLGGTETLIEHRASIEPLDTNTPRSLLRVSVGLEDADDLIEDLLLAIENADYIIKKL